MGLDMYLTGQRYYMSSSGKRKKDKKGYEIKTQEVELGYWRKHPDLHGLIVEDYGGGVDECQRIDLTVENLKAIIENVKNDKLPKTSGFFFGESGKPGDEYYDREKKETIQTLEGAIAWLEEKEKDVWKSVYYQASW